jgi:uncharacterized protein YutE (UPF0331/DUF86 family)
VRLNSLAGLSADEFASDPDNLAIAEHHLRRALECALDLGRHVVARMALGHADEYTQVPRLLGESGVISAATAASLQRSAKLRNRLVHLYWQVDTAEVHSLLPGQIEVLEAVCAEVWAFLGHAPDATGSAP